MPVQSGETIEKSVVNTAPTSASCTTMRMAAISRPRCIPSLKITERPASMKTKTLAAASTQ
jgi:hypothetical protein